MCCSFNNENSLTLHTRNSQTENEMMMMNIFWQYHRKMNIFLNNSHKRQKKRNYAKFLKESWSDINFKSSWGFITQHILKYVNSYFVLICACFKIYFGKYFLGIKISPRWKCEWKCIFRLSRRLALSISSLFLSWRWILTFFYALRHSNAWGMRFFQSISEDRGKWMFSKTSAYFSFTAAY